MRERSTQTPRDSDARRQKSHSPPSHTRPRSRSRTPAQFCAEDEWNGIIAHLKQMSDDPFDAQGCRDGGWAKCNACHRMKCKLAFSRNQQRYKNTAMRRCRLCVRNDHESTDIPPDAERSYQANREKWRTDKAWAQQILDDAFPGKHKTTYDTMRSALIAHWDDMLDKRLIPGSHSRGSGGAQPPPDSGARRQKSHSPPSDTVLRSRSRTPASSRSTDENSDYQSEDHESMSEDEPGPEVPSREAFELNRQGHVCLVNVTVPSSTVVETNRSTEPSPEASSTVAETDCLIELAKDIATSTGSIICIQRATPSMVMELNVLPPPRGHAQNFWACFQGGLLIAARSTFAMGVKTRMKMEWPDLGIMLVAEVHFRNSLAGFQFLTVANISMHKPMDSDTTIGTLRAMAADIVEIIAETHVQVLAGDFGCALFALAALIRGSGVQLHVAALRSGTDNSDTEPFLDSCAVFIVGPVSEVKSLLPIGDTELPAAIRSGSSVRLPWYIHGYGEPPGATGKARIDTLLEGEGDGSITEEWQTMPRSQEKPARTFTHNDDTISAGAIQPRSWRAQRSCCSQVIRGRAQLLLF